MREPRAGKLRPGGNAMIAGCVHRPQTGSPHAWWRLAIGLLLGALVASSGNFPASAQVGVSVVINSVEAQYNPLEDGYDVTSFLSVLDPEGQPIPDLTPSNLAVREDGSDVESFELSPSTEGLSLVLAIDTSGSMAAAGKMDAVREASAAFIEGMGKADQVGLLSFNEKSKLEISITSDREGVQNFINLLQPVRDASTCLWDAAFEAVEVASSVHQGRRVVILLTDGIDERLTGGGCSTKTLEDVIALASDTTVRVPVYTLGVGRSVSAQDLARLSDLTGGRSLLAADAREVGDVFSRFGLELSRGYVLRYRTAATSGEHSLFVQVEIQGSRDQETRKFRVPELPGRASFSGIQNQQVVSEDLAISLEISGEGVPARAEFYVDDQLASEDAQPPFETLWRIEGRDPGPYVLRAVVYDEDGDVLAVAKVEVSYKPPEIVPTAVPPGVSLAIGGLTPGQQVKGTMALTAAVDPPEVVDRVEFLVDGFRIGEDRDSPYEILWETDQLERGEHVVSAVAFGASGESIGRDELTVIYAPPRPLLLVVGLPALALALAGGGLLAIRRYRRQRPPGGRNHVASVGGPPPSVAHIEEPPRAGEAGTLASLTVEACQDPDLIGQRFEIWEREVVIGRSPECEMVIPVQPVSRKHAVIRLGDRTDDLSLTMDEIGTEEPAMAGREATLPFRIFDGDPGTGQPSTYGTYVDNVRASPETGRDLKDGSRIRLGRSIAEGRIPPVVLLFRDLREQRLQSGEAELTSDELILSGFHPTALEGPEQRDGASLSVGDEAGSEDSGIEEDGTPDAYETEDFDLEGPSGDEFKAEGSGPDDQDELV